MLLLIATNNLFTSFTASVELSTSKKDDDVSGDDFIDKNAIQIARQLQRLRGLDEDDKSSEESPYGNRVDKRKIVYNLDRRAHKQNKVGTLDVAFRKRFQHFSNNLNDGKLLDTTLSYFNSFLIIRNSYSG